MKPHLHYVKVNNIHAVEEIKIQLINCICVTWNSGHYHFRFFSVAQIKINMTHGAVAKMNIKTSSSFHDKQSTSVGTYFHIPKIIYILYRKPFFLKMHCYFEKVEMKRT